MNTTMIPARVVLGSMTLLAFMSASAGAQAPVAPGRMVSVNTRSMWIECAGVGQPTVVLEAGHNESADTWNAVFSSLASITRVCRYDRAGLGRSDAVSARGLRTGRHVVSDLHALLGRAGEQRPAVLVGHSLGGAFVRLYAAAHPQRTAALVLIDAVHENESTAIDAFLTPAQRAQSAGMVPMTPEGIDIEAVFAELRVAPKPIAIPVVVVARGRPLAADEMPPMWSPEQRRQREQVRRDLRADLATLSPKGELIIALRSGHFVHQDEPSLVLEAVRKVVVEWRREGNPR